MSARGPTDTAPSDQTPPPGAAVTDTSGESDVVAPPPAMPVQTTLYIGPDGSVSFGALFGELVPVARSLDPSFAPGIPAPAGRR